MRALGLAISVGVAVLLAGCTGGAYTSQSIYSTCENRGYAPGSKAYNRCLSDLRGREQIDYSNTKRRLRSR